MQIMLQISSMVLQSMMPNETRFDDEREMSVDDDGLHGWTWGPVVGACFGRGRRESGVRWCGSDAETVPDIAR